MSGKAFGAGATSRVVDASKRELSKVSQISSVSGGRLNIAAINLDGNNLSTLHGIKQFPALIQLSVSDNSLVRMEEVCVLRNLVSLNLQNNSLSEITGLEKLVHLEWLCLAGNSIKSMEGLSTNIRISHLDLSDNCIGSIASISMLCELKTLLLHGNAIMSLEGVEEKLPQSLNTFTLSENEIEDLNEVFFLSLLPSLHQLSLMSNPCVSLADSAVFDYRPYVCYWCPGLKTLDGFPITDNERSISSGLFPTDQPCPFSLGQHRELVNYLHSVSPLHPAQLIMGTPSYTGNSNTLSSVSDLEDIIRSYEQHISDPKQADIVEKLKALQLVEQMIKNQEHMLLTQQNNNDEISNPQSTRSEELNLSNELHLEHVPPRPVLNAWAETSPRKSHSPPPALPEKPLVNSSDQNTVSSTCALSKPAEEHKTERLKRLNAKLAQRHSKVAPKGNRKDSTQEASSSLKTRKAATKPASRKVKPKLIGTSKGLCETSKTSTHQSLRKETKSLKTSTGPNTSRALGKTKNSNLKGVTLTQSTPFEAPAHPKENSDKPGSVIQTALSIQPIPSRNEPAFSISQTHSNVPAIAEQDLDLLSSTSYLVPLSDDPLSEVTLDSQFEAALEQESLLHSRRSSCSNILASSLTQAYGLPDEAESSKVLTALWKETGNTSVQFDTGKAVLKSFDEILVAPVNIETKPELNGNELKECVAQNTIQLQGCRQELAHQSQLLQLQEEILQSLLGEVEALRKWKVANEIKERGKAAIVIQKHWRGYKARKTHSVQTNLSRNAALWSLCMSLQNQVTELRSVVSALSEKNKKVRFEEDPKDDYPPPIELRMSHYSISCILLKWTPALPSGRLDTLLKCYRVYVNGEVEGMVGPEKCKAYIEGLDRGTTYRITVRAMYNRGESQDSNPVVASLNPTKPTNLGSPSDQSPNHSDDEERGDLNKHRPSPAGPSQPQSSSGEQQDAIDDSSEQPASIGQPNDENVGVSVEGLYHLVAMETLTDDKQLVTAETLVKQLENTFKGDPKDAVSKNECLIHGSQNNGLENDDHKDTPPQFHCLKPKHITMDTMTVTSGGTMEYSLPQPIPSTSANTLLGESSLAMDPATTETLDTNTKTNDGGDEPKLERLEQELTLRQTKDNSSNTPNVPIEGNDETKEVNDYIKGADEQYQSNRVNNQSQVVNAAPLVGSSGTLTATPDTQLIQELPAQSFHLHVHESFTPTSKQSHVVSVLPPMSHNVVPESDQLSLGMQHAQTLVNTLPAQNGNSGSHVFTQTAAVCQNKTIGYFKANDGLEFHTDHPYAMTEQHLSASTELSCTTPHSNSEYQKPSLDPRNSMISETTGHINNKLGSDISPSAKVTQDAETIPRNMSIEIHTESPPLKNSITSAHATSLHGTSSINVASQLLMDLEKSLSQSD